MVVLEAGGWDHFWVWLNHPRLGQSLTRSESREVGEIHGVPHLRGTLGIARIKWKSLLGQMPKVPPVPWQGLPVASDVRHLVEWLGTNRELTINMGGFLKRRIPGRHHGSQYSVMA